MKAIHLNLASRPYRDDRPFYGTAGALAIVTLFLLVNNVQTALQYLSSTRTTRDEITALENEIAAEQKKSQTLDVSIKRVDLKDLNAHTTYVNEQIAERAFSWSALLDELEEVVPADVRVTDLNPSIDKMGRVKLRLDCVAKKQDGMVRMLRALLANPQFEGAFPQMQAIREDGSHTFALEVTYLPKRGALRR